MCMYYPGPAVARPMPTTTDMKKARQADSTFLSDLAERAHAKSLERAR